ncbi:MAG: RNA-binding cell elongation regulator Jag/EloR [Acidimicrobiia bacterium]
MEWVETTGPDLNAAKERALDQLGVADGEAEFEIVSEAKAGIFGIGKSDARVRARVKPRQPRAKAEGRRKRSQGNRRGGKSNGGNGGQNKGGQSKGGQSKGGQNRGGQNKGGQSKGGQNKGGQNKSGKSTEQGKRKESVVTERMDVEEQSEVAVEFVQGLVDGFGADGTATVEVDEEILTVNVDGEGLGLLVGPQGATLRSVEELTRTVVQRRADGRKYHRIRVDVGGYKQRRREALESFTQDLASKVQEDGVSRALEPMAAPDRKIVHDTVIEISGVDTISEGEEPRRRVVLVASSGE